MKISINNKLVEYAGLNQVALAKALADCNAPVAGIAVAVNGRVIKKDDRADFILNDDDSVVVIKAVCGG